MEVARVEDREAGRDLRPDVAEVRQLRPIQLSKDARPDEPLQEGPRRHHHIVARAAGQELGLQDLVGVVGVVHEPDAGLGREPLQHLGIDVVRPVVDIDDALGGLGGHRQGKTQDQDGADHGQRDCSWAGGHE